MEDNEDHERNELASLLESIGKGGEAAFSDLYRRTAPRLFGFCLRMIADRSEAEEALQDAYLRIWKYAPTYRSGKSSPLTWMLMLCRSACMDRLRRNHAKSRQFETAGEQLSDADDQGLNEEDGRDAVALADTVERSIAALPETQRRVIELAFYEGYSQSEIAAREQRPLGSVKSDLRRALMRLRKRFDTQHD